MRETTVRADQLLDEGDMAGAETWHRILNAIERLRANISVQKVRLGAAARDTRGQEGLRHLICR